MAWPIMGPIQLPTPDDVSPYYVDCRDFGMRGNGDYDNATALITAYSQLESNHVLMLPRGEWVFTAGQSTKKRISIMGTGPATRILWQPATPGATLFTWTNASASVSDLNEEGNLDAVHVGGFKIEGDRVTQGNALEFDRCDWVVLDAVTVEGVCGSSLKVTNSREFHWSRYRSRYNGYADATNFADSVDDVILSSPDAGVDTTNFWTGSQIWIAYSLAGNLRMDNADQIVIAPYQIHDLPEGNATLEQNFVALYGGTVGFSGGVAGNAYAALHAYSTGNESSVSGLSFNGTGKARKSVRARACQNVRLSAGTIRGGRTNALVWADAASELYLSNTDIQGGNASTTVSGTCTFDSGTDAATVATISAPQTGEPVRFTTTGALPAELVVGTTYYVIRTGAATCKLASSLVNAEAGTAINLSGAGTGTHTMHSIQGYAIRATGGSKVWLDATCSLDDCRQATYHDATTGHNVYGVPRLGGSWSDLSSQTQPFVIGPSLASGPGVQAQDTVSRKFGFHGSTPSVQRSGSAQAAVATTSATNSTPYGYSTQAQADAIVTLLNELRAACVEKGLIKGSA